MAKKTAAWKKGRGKLGVLAPLFGTWKATAKSPIGTVRCTRSFVSILGGAYVQLTAQWKFAKGTYREQAIFGVDDGKLSFWSFTSDGKRSQGTLADVSDIHPQAIGFEAKMPAGLARMAYWPHDDGGFSWAVEARTQKGWKRFTQHHYLPA
jgi:hypothetical protein